MGRHQATGYCEVVIAVFVFGAKYCMEESTEKLDDPISNREHWICDNHLHTLMKQEARAASKN